MDPEAVADQVVPPLLKKWNWGAFFLTIIWGIFNKAPKTGIAAFIAVDIVLFLFKSPSIGFVAVSIILNVTMAIVFGLRGNRWAWKGRSWEGVDQFNMVQRRWARGGILYIATPVVLVLLMAGIMASTIGWQNFEALFIKPLEIESGALPTPLNSSTPAEWKRFITSIVGGPGNLQIEFDLPPGFSEDCKLECSALVDGTSGEIIRKDIAQIGYSGNNAGYIQHAYFIDPKTNAWTDLGKIIPNSTSTLYVTEGGVLVRAFINQTSGAWALIWAFDQNGNSIDPYSITESEIPLIGQHSLMSYEGTPAPLSLEAQILKTITVLGSSPATTTIPSSAIPADSAAGQ